MSSGLAALLSKLIDKISSSVGRKQKKRILSVVVEEIGSLLTNNADMLKKYGVYQDLYRVIQH